MRRRGSGSLTRAQELHARAVDAYAAARPRAARALSERALAQLDGTPEGELLRVRLLITLALSVSELDGAGPGLAVLAEAEDHAERRADLTLRVLVRSQRGALAIRVGDFTSAVREYARTRELLQHASVVDQSVILANAGTAALYTGDLRSARPLLTRAVELADACGEVRRAAMSRHNLGYVEFLAGDLPKALHELALAAATPELPEGVPLLDRARVLTEAGLLSEAEACLARAAELFTRERVVQDLGETEIERSRVALLRGDIAAARRFAARARDRFRRRDNPRWRQRAELALLQAELVGHRPATRLVPSALRLQREFAADGLRLPARTAALIAAEAHAGAGEAELAAQIVAGLGPPRRSDPITNRLQYAYLGALIDTESGRPTAATRRVRRALDSLTAYQASFGSIDMRTSAAIHGRRLVQLDIALARRGGRVASVFAAAERARATTSRLPPVRPPADPAAADLLAELRQTTEALRAAEFDRAAAAPLHRRRQELEREIVARGWGAAGGGMAVQPTALEPVRAELDRRDRTMAMFVHDGDQLSAVVVGEKLRLVDLGPAAPVIESVRRCRADLDVLAGDRLPAPLRVAVCASLQSSLAALDAALVAPLAVDRAALVVISTGVLGQLPWASLRSLRGVPVVVAPSATKWLASTAPAGQGVTTVALAGPDLARSAAEVVAVAQQWPAGRAVAAATRAELMEAIAHTNLLHVAAHGLHQAENPLFSSLRMSDGPVFAHELSGTAPAHVVLSACDVGLTTIRPGDEALGLASVLLHLGTRSVVASVARVNDAQAEATMLAYHRHLRAGADSSAALAQALAEGEHDMVAPFVNFGAAWLPGESVAADGFGVGAAARVP